MFENPERLLKQKEDATLFQSEAVIPRESCYGQVLKHYHPSASTDSFQITTLWAQNQIQSLHDVRFLREIINQC